jgi:hypothetical protein
MARRRDIIRLSRSPAVLLGGTKRHSELLAPFGLDAREPAFWQGGLSVITRMIDELETLRQRAVSAPIL